MPQSRIRLGLKLSRSYEKSYDEYHIRIIEDIFRTCSAAHGLGLIKNSGINIVLNDIIPCEDYTTYHKQ